MARLSRLGPPYWVQSALALARALAGAASAGRLPRHSSATKATKSAVDGRSGTGRHIMDAPALRDSRARIFNPCGFPRDWTRVSILAPSRGKGEPRPVCSHGFRPTTARPEPHQVRHASQPEGHGTAERHSLRHRPVAGLRLHPWRARVAGRGSRGYPSAPGCRFRPPRAWLACQWRHRRPPPGAQGIVAADCRK